MKLSEILAAREKAKEKAAEGATRVSTAPPPEPTGKNALKVVRTRETPNDDALQYVVNAVVLDSGNKSYASKTDCADDPLGQALFALEGVDNVYVMQNFVTVTKKPDVKWLPLKDKIWKAIDKHVAVYKVVDEVVAAEIDVENFPNLSNADKIRGVEMVLNRSIRTNLAADGGGVEVKGIEGNLVSIQYHGACGSCATSTSGTLKYIETQLKQQLHSDLKVQPV